MNAKDEAERWRKAKVRIRNLKRKAEQSKAEVGGWYSRAIQLRKLLEAATTFLPHRTNTNAERCWCKSPRYPDKHSQTCVDIRAALHRRWP